MVEASSSYDQCSTGWTAMIIVMMVMRILMIAIIIVMMEITIVMTAMIIVIMVKMIVIMVMIIVMMAVMIAMMVMIMAKDGGNHLPALCRFDDVDDGIGGTQHSPE